MIRGIILLVGKDYYFIWRWLDSGVHRSGRGQRKEMEMSRELRSATWKVTKINYSKYLNPFRNVNNK